MIVWREERVKNVIDLAKLTKEVYRATNELLMIVVNIKSKTKKAKTYSDIYCNVLNKEDEMSKACGRITDAVMDLIKWAHDGTS